MDRYCNCHLYLDVYVIFTSEFAPILLLLFQMYQKCGLVERAIKILEDHVNSHVECDNSVINLLIALYIENGSHMEALKLIERACSICGLGKKNLLYLKVKEAVCHAQLGNMQHAEVCS